MNMGQGTKAGKEVRILACKTIPFQLKSLPAPALPIPLPPTPSSIHSNRMERGGHLLDPNELGFLSPNLLPNVNGLICIMGRPGLCGYVYFFATGSKELAVTHVDFYLSPPTPKRYSRKI